MQNNISLYLSFVIWDYVTAFCIENNKQQLNTTQINEAITKEVSYARVKLLWWSAKWMNTYPT